MGQAKRPNALIPRWFPASHPLSLSPGAQDALKREFDPHGIFLNIPYADRYTNLELAILATVTAYGLVPRMAKSRVGLEVRLQKIARLMLSCAYGITDLTYGTRMNMPLELGLLLAWGKDTFVVSSQPYKNLRTISDLNFGDIRFHRGAVRRLIRELSRWVEQNCSAQRFGIGALLKRYRRLRTIRTSLGDDFDKLTPSVITTVLGIIKEEFSIKLPPGE